MQISVRAYERRVQCMRVCVCVCAAVRCVGAAQCGAVRCGAAQRGEAQCGTARCGACTVVHMHAAACCGVPCRAVVRVAM